MLQGSLDNFTLDEVLSLLSATSKTGRLAISGDRGTGSLWLDDGSVVGADASNMVGTSPANDVMFELLRFEAGSFLFTMDDRLDTPGVAEDVDTLLEGAQRRIVEWRTIEAVVPSLQHELWLTRPLESDEITLSRHDWDVVVVVGEGKTVGAVCDELEFDEVDGSRKIKGLVERGVLIISEQPAASVALAPGARAPLEQAHTGFSESLGAPSDLTDAAAGFVDAGEVAGFAPPVVSPERHEIDTALSEPVAEFEFLDQDALRGLEDAALSQPTDTEAPAPSGSFGASLAGDMFNASAEPLRADPSAGLHDLLSEDEPVDVAAGFEQAPAFEAAPELDSTPAFDSAPAFESPAPMSEPAPVAFDSASDAGRPPMPPPPAFGTDGSIQPPPPPSAVEDSLTDIEDSLTDIEDDDDDEASLLMRYLKSDSH